MQVDSIDKPQTITKWKKNKCFNERDV